MVCFGSLAEIHHTPKAAAQTAGVAGKPDAAIGNNRPILGARFDASACLRTQISQPEPRILPIALVITRCGQ